MEEEVDAVDDLGDRKDALPVDGDQPGATRRDFLKKAAVVGLALPAAGALAGPAAARPSIRVRDRGRSQFEGATLQFAKAPFGTDEKDFIPNTLKKSTYQGKLYGLPCIIGGTVMFYNKDLLAKAGVTKIPTNMTELTAASLKVTDAPNVWGFN